MKKLMLSSLLMMLTACGGKNQPQVTTWASGTVSAGNVEAMDVEVLKFEDAVERDSEPADVEEAADNVGQMMKAAATAKYFTIDPKLVRLAHGSAQFWLGCNATQLVRGGYDSNSKCGKAYLHPVFSKQMQSRFFICSERAAAKAGIAQPQKIFLNHVGTYNNRSARNSSRLSMHAYARAVDIGSWNLYDARGKVTRISTNVRNYRGTTKTFYNEFRQCWKEAMPKSCTPSKTEYKGSIGIPSSALGGNKLHNDHIHLSFAPCAG